VFVRVGQVRVAGPPEEGRHTERGPEHGSLELVGEQLVALDRAVRWIVVERLQSRHDRVPHRVGLDRRQVAGVMPPCPGLRWWYGGLRLPAHQRSQCRVLPEELAE